MATPATLEGFDFYAKTYQRYLEPMVLLYNRNLQQLEPISFKGYWLFTFHCIFVNGFIAFGSSLIVMMRYILLPHKSEESKLSILSISSTVMILIFCLFFVFLFDMFVRCNYEICYIWNNLKVTELLHNKSKEPPSSIP
jgi:uncharacterized membrane protein YbhN (UPF0104 family)